MNIITVILTSFFLHQNIKKLTFINTLFLVINWVINIFLVDTYNYNDWLKNEKSTDKLRKIDKEESDMPPIEDDDEEAKERKGLKIVIYIFCISIVKSRKKFTTI